jgi:hypothetical protein
LLTTGNRQFVKAGAVFGEQRQVLLAKLNDVFIRGPVQSVAGAI